MAEADGEPELEVLLSDEETFPPPPEFSAQANVSDPSIYEEAERDPEGWWERWARQLDWAEDWSRVLDWEAPQSRRYLCEGRVSSRPCRSDRRLDCYGSARGGVGAPSVT